MGMRGSTIKQHLYGAGFSEMILTSIPPLRDCVKREKERG